MRRRNRLYNTYHSTQKTRSRRERQSSEHWLGEERESPRQHVAALLSDQLRNEMMFIIP